jgi:hypothetical protein
MRIQSRPIKLAFTFGFVYITLVALQTWHVSFGPVNPSPPAEWPTAQRAFWFAMLTVGMSFPFYVAATSSLIPVLRALTWPMRRLPRVAGGLVSLVVGAGFGVIVLALVTSTRITSFANSVSERIQQDPALTTSVILATTLGPLIFGLVLGRNAR